MLKKRIFIFILTILAVNCVHLQSAFAVAQKKTTVVGPTDEAIEKPLQPWELSSDEARKTIIPPSQQSPDKTFTAAAVQPPYFCIE